MAQKPETEKKKRGRKPKQEVQQTEQTTIETTAETTTEPVEVQQSEVVEAIPVVKDNTVRYNHYRYQRCNARLNGRSHPAFMQNNMVCNTIMQSYKTTDGGKMKHYKCPRCGSVKVTEGEVV